MDDSPLSICANVTGILTFVFAIAAATYVRVAYLRNSHAEYLRVKKSLRWFKTESEWLSCLHPPPKAPQSAKALSSHWPEIHMYGFIMDDLLTLERRLLQMIEQIEPPMSMEAVEEEHGLWSWTNMLLPWSWLRGRPSVTLAWLSSRTEMLELVRQREALTGRVQFLQLSMLSSRLSELEERTSWLGAVSSGYRTKLEAYGGT